MFLGLVYSF